MIKTYPIKALTSQQMALKNAKATLAFHSAQVAVPPRAIPFQLKTYLSSVNNGSMLPPPKEGDNLPARTIQPINHESKSNEPHNRHEEIGRPVDERRAEGEQPDESQEDGQAGDHLGIDEAPLVPGGSALGGVEVLARQTGHDGGEGDLRQAEDHGDQACEDHFGGSW